MKKLSFTPATAAAVFLLTGALSFAVVTSPNLPLINSGDPILSVSWNQFVNEFNNFNQPNKLVRQHDDGSIQATKFIGDGSELTNLPVQDISGKLDIDGDGSQLTGISLFTVLKEAASRIGIGTETPQARLSVIGEGNSTATVGLNVTDSSGASNFLVRDSGDVEVKGKVNTQGNITTEGTIKIATTAEACAAGLAGTLRYNTTTNAFEGCNGTEWGKLSGVVAEAPVVTAAEFETILYTGNGSTQTINTEHINTGVDFVWIKARNYTDSSEIVDSIRGVGKNLRSNETSIEETRDNITSFASSSFNIGTDPIINRDTYSFVAWVASLPNHNPNNTNGTITSETKCNSFMCAVSYTGNGISNATVGHGLNSTPEFLVIKSRETSQIWKTWTSGGRMRLNDIHAIINDSFSTIPNTTIINTGAVDTASNTNGEKYIAYAFTSVAGKSKVGSYTGTGASGNTINTGFEPQWVMIKRTDGTGDWKLFDNKRISGSLKKGLKPNSNGIEDTGDNILLTSTGFTLNTTGNTTNILNGEYIYLTIAKN